MVDEWEANAVVSNAKAVKDPETGKSVDVIVPLITTPVLSKPHVLDSTKQASLFISLLASFLYGGASVAMAFLNKAVLTHYPYSMTLLFFQQLAAASIIQVGVLFGVVKVQRLNLAAAKRLLPLALVYNANVGISLASLQGVNIPMYTALKRLTPLGVLLAGFCITKKRPTLQVALSVVVTAAGVVVAALDDFSFDPMGYSVALSSVFFQTTYLLLVERSGVEDGLSSIELMLYNSVLSLPSLAIFLFASLEYKTALPILIAKAESTEFFFLLLVSLLMGIILNFSVFLCTLVNSALTTSIVGILKGVFSTVLGFYLLGGVELYVLSVTGLLLNTLGGLWYSFAKYRLKNLKAKATEKSGVKSSIPTSRHPSVP